MYAKRKERADAKKRGEPVGPKKKTAPKKKAKAKAPAAEEASPPPPSEEDNAMEEEEEEDDDGDDGDEVREVGVVDPDEVGCWCGTAEREGQEFDGNWIVCDECAEPAVWHHVQCNFPGIRAADLPEEEWVCPLCFSGRGVVEAKRAVREVCLDLTTISGLEIEPTKISYLYGELKPGGLHNSYFGYKVDKKPAAVLEAVRRVRSLLVDTLYVKAGGDVGAVEHVSAPRLQAALDALKGSSPLSSPEVVACEKFIGWAVAAERRSGKKKRGR